MAGFAEHVLQIGFRGLVGLLFKNEFSLSFLGFRGWWWWWFWLASRDSLFWDLNMSSVSLLGVLVRGCGGGGFG